MTENVILHLSVLSSWRYVFISEKAYQETETRPESSVYTLMKGTAVHGDDILDTVEYVRPSEVSPNAPIQLMIFHLLNSVCIVMSYLPINLTFSSQGGDVISTILRREVTYDQKQGTCAEVRGQQELSQWHCMQDKAIICFYSIQHFMVANANCTRDSDCVQGEVDFDGHGTFFTPHKTFLQASLIVLFHSLFFIFSYRKKDRQMCSVLQPHLQNLWDPNMVSYWAVRCCKVRQMMDYPPKGCPESVYLQSS